MSYQKDLQLPILLISIVRKWNGKHFINTKKGKEMEKDGGLTISLI
ncbi:MAG: hypothetical protein JO297_11430 [Nitrososphaeraceae archaeon]|nr:hypothetical protein [Nitrososphaeraceae archaeon]